MKKFILKGKDGYYHGIDFNDELKFVDVKSRACKYWGRELADKRAKELDLSVVEYED